MPRLRICFGLVVLSASSLSGVEWRAEVDPWILTHVSTETEAEFLVLLEAQADLGRAAEITDKTVRGQYVVEQLKSLASRTQKPILAELERLGVDHRSFWVANMIWVKGNAPLVESLATRADVKHLYANPQVQLQLPDSPTEEMQAPGGIEPNLTQIGAPDFWTAGFTGQGVVIAGQDTGYRWDHEALKEQYRGWNGISADHDYNWHDSIHVGGGVCGADSAEPCDDHGHGTHTVGTMVGDDGAANQIGVAPGARWIGCRNMDEGNGTPASYAECFEFFMAPTRVDGSDPDPSMAPHVINNSWVCPSSEGCTNPNALKTVVENTRAAGIMVVASAGNSGSSCGSVSDPPAIYDAAFSIGAVNSSETIWSRSSRGGVTVDGSNRLKPDVTAPGVSIRSSTRNGIYGSMSGTSMAGPHVAGQVALLISAVPELAGRVEVLETCIEATALPRMSTQTCSGIPGSQIPNNVFGRGRIELALPLPVECSAEFVFGDDFEAGAPSGWDQGTQSIP